MFRDYKAIFDFFLYAI